MFNNQQIFYRLENRLWQKQRNKISTKRGTHENKYEYTEIFKKGQYISTLRFHECGLKIITVANKKIRS